MCDFDHDHPLPSLRRRRVRARTRRTVREFVADVRGRIAAADSPQASCEAIGRSSPNCSPNGSGCPIGYQRDAPQSGMGGGIGQWLLFRAADRSLCLFSLVVPSGLDDPRPRPPRLGPDRLVSRQSGRGVLPARPRTALSSCAGARSSRATSTRLLPPQDDVHRVRTTSDCTSVSIHLLANDTGCILRHTYDEQTGQANARSAPAT